MNQIYPLQHSNIINSQKQIETNFAEGQPKEVCGHSVYIRRELYRRCIYIYTLAPLALIYTYTHSKRERDHSGALAPRAVQMVLAARVTHGFDSWELVIPLG